MKIKELLNESVTDIIARFYKEASKESDRYMNPEDIKYKDLNKEYYQQYFKSWFNEGLTPIFKKPVTKPQPEYTNHPKDGKLQSPGFRGQQYTLAKAGLPYDHSVQKYDPTIPIASTQTTDGARNNNGQ